MEGEKNLPEGRNAGKRIGQTILALPIAFIVWVAAAIASGFVLTIWNRLFTVVRPEIIEFFAALAAAVFGMVAARAANDRLFRHYARRPIFILFAVLGLLEIAIVLFVLPDPEAPITVCAQAVVMVMSAFAIFWRVEPTTTTP